VLPFEFRVNGPPVSAQTRNKDRLRAWKQQVRDAAQAKIPAGVGPVDTAVTVTITYYYEGDSPDVDNIIKPIQDAMNGVVFADDAQVVETRSRKKSLDGSYRIRGISPVVLLGFADGDDFLHVVVQEPADEQDLAQ